MIYWDFHGRPSAELTENELKKSSRSVDESVMLLMSEEEDHDQVHSFMASNTELVDMTGTFWFSLAENWIFTLT